MTLIMEKILKSALNHSSQRFPLITLAGLYYAKSDLHKVKLLKSTNQQAVLPKSINAQLFNSTANVHRES